jgi:hypothetical protein
MINLRYHIVSITAVFLALAIGLALGSTLIQRGIVDTLETRLDELGERLDRTDGENAALRGDLEALDAASERLAAARDPLLAGHLDDQPVLLLAVQGTDDDLIAEARQSLRAAGSQVSGTLSFTARWESLTADEVAELSSLFDRRLNSEQVARNLVLRRVAEELYEASEPEPEPEVVEPPEVVDDPELSGGPEAIPGAPPTEGAAPADEGAATLVPLQADPDAPEDPGVPVAPDEPVEPLEPAVPETGIIDALIGLGYLEFFPESAGTPLPSFGTRYLMVADDDAVLPVGLVAVTLLDALAQASGGVAPIVVAGPLAPPPDPGDVSERPDPAERLPLLVRAIRDDEQLRAQVSTVDALHDFVGHAAMVLALAHLDLVGVGHYGVGVGATTLWPAIAS